MEYPMYVEKGQLNCSWEEHERIIQAEATLTRLPHFLIHEPPTLFLVYSLSVWVFVVERARRLGEIIIMSIFLQYMLSLSF